MRTQSLSHHYVVKGLHHASLVRCSFELQYDTEGQQYCDAGHSGRTQYSKEKHLPMSSKAIQL